MCSVKHTNELIKKLYQIVILFFIMMLVGWFISDSIIYYLISLSSFKIITTLPFEMLQTKFGVAIAFAFFISIPYIYIELYKFILPGLYKKELTILKWSTLPFLFMFVSGLIFSIKVFLPLMLMYVGSFYIDNITNSVTLNSYISFILSSMLLFGVIFCIPVVLSILSYIGVINYTIMKTYRRHVYISLLIASAIITPPDIMTQLLVSIPLIVLYEMSIGVSYVMSLSKSKNNIINKIGDKLC